MLDQRPQRLDILRSRDREIDEEIAVGEPAAGYRLIVARKLFLFGPKEEDAHQVAGIADDALLHQLVGAFQCRGDGAVLVDSFGIRGRWWRWGQHGLVDFNEENDGILG